MRDGYGLFADAPGQDMPLREDKSLPKAYFPNRLPPSFDLSEDVIKEYGKAM